MLCQAAAWPCEGTVAQRTATTAGQRKVLTALELSEPVRFFDFAPTSA